VTQGRITHLLPELHDLEALEVVELLPLLELGALLGPGALGPLLVNLLLLPLLGNETTSGSAGKLGDDDRGKRHLGECDCVARDGCILGGTVNKHLGFCERRAETGIRGISYTLVVDDLDNGG
jgi:hypothetical protein